MGQEPLGALKNLFDFCRTALDATADAQQRAMGSCTSLCLGSSAANANASAAAARQCVAGRLDAVAEGNRIMVLALVGIGEPGMRPDPPSSASIPYPPVPR